MRDTFRTPDGETYKPEDLEKGLTCSRCGEFVKIRSDLPPKVKHADYVRLTIKKIAGTDTFIFDDRNVNLCLKCSGKLRTWLENDGATFEAIEDVEEGE